MKMVSHFSLAPLVALLVACQQMPGGVQQQAAASAPPEQSVAPSQAPQPSVTPTSSPGPQVDVQTVTFTPNPACIGQTVMLDGKGFPGSSVEIWLEPSSMEKGQVPPTANGVKLGDASVSNQGTFSFSFKLESTMKPTQSGGQLTLDPAKNYHINVFSNNRGQMNGYDLPLCSQ